MSILLFLNIYLASEYHYIATKYSVDTTFFHIIINKTLIDEYILDKLEIRLQYKDSTGLLQKNITNIEQDILTVESKEALSGILDIEISDNWAVYTIPFDDFASKALSPCIITVNICSQIIMTYSYKLQDLYEKKTICVKITPSLFEFTAYVCWIFKHNIRKDKFAIYKKVMEPNDYYLIKENTEKEDTFLKNITGKGILKNMTILNIQENTTYMQYYEEAKKLFKANIAENMEILKKYKEVIVSGDESIRKAKLLQTATDLENQRKDMESKRAANYANRGNKDCNTNNQGNDLSGTQKGGSSWIYDYCYIWGLLLGICAVSTGVIIYMKLKS